ncbi:hypothetical protein M3Y98_01007600 [Aphelenchoides besseyi]|nr:hypothetical protein M3Y98_01007600 [Aphelenchoides besseyi]
MANYNALKSSFEEKLKAYRVAENCALSAAEVLVSMQQLIVEEKMAIERERAEWNNQRVELEQKHRDLINERNEARRDVNEQTTEIQRLRTVSSLSKFCFTLRVFSKSKFWRRRIERGRNAPKLPRKNVLDSSVQIRELQQKNSGKFRNILFFTSVSELQQNCLVKENEKKHLLSDIQTLERDRVQSEADFAREKAQITKRNLQELEEIKETYKKALKTAQCQVDQLAPFKQECETLRATNKMLKNQAEGYRRLMRKG